jgi:hypothetical protein
MKKYIGVIILGMLLAIAVTLHAQGSVHAEQRANLAEARRLSKAAYDKILEAQRANEWDMGGHAEKAKHLLEQANEELRLAAESTHEHH